jgi:tetrahydromethanopterin S-methyltransferase subunit G
MQDTELIEKLAHLEEREKSNTKRLDDHDNRLDNLEKTYSIMEKMDYRMGQVETAVDKIDKKLDSKVHESDKEKGKKWDKLVDYIFYTILGAIMLLVLSKVGL